MNEQYAFRVRPFDRKHAGVIRGKTVGRVDPDRTTIEAVRYVERLKLHRCPAIGWYFDFAGRDGVAVHHQRDGLGCSRRSIAGDHRLHSRFLRVFRVGKLSRSVDPFDRPVRRGAASHRMQDHRYIRRQLHVGEVCRYAGFLHIAEQVQLDRCAHGLNQGAHSVRKLA